MKNENEKKGLMGRIFGGKKEKGCCCGNFRIEEVPGKTDRVDESKTISKPKNNCCDK